MTDKALISENITLKAEVKRLSIDLERSRAEAEGVKEYFRLNLPKLTSVAGMNLERVSNLLGALLTCQNNISRHLNDLRNNNTDKELLELDSIDFFVGKTVDVIAKIQHICSSTGLSEDLPGVIGENSHDYVFNEFKVDSSQRLITVGSRDIYMPQAEFAYLLELIRSPNTEVHFDKPADQARTGIARLKHRVPALKTLIRPVYGKASYQLHVTSITTK